MSSANVSSRFFIPWVILTGPLKFLGLLITVPLTFLAKLQLGMTAWRFLQPVAGWVYLAWFILLALIPGWLGFSGAVLFWWGGGILALAFGLVWVYFQHDSEKRSAIRGLLEGEGDIPEHRVLRGGV